MSGVLQPKKCVTLGFRATFSNTRGSGSLPTMECPSEKQRRTRLLAFWRPEVDKTALPHPIRASRSSDETKEPGIG